MFEVNPSDAAPTVPMDLKLPGDTRAESRARFEEANARRIAEQERARAEEERERVASDERERRRLRRSTVFKARAVPDYAELATVGWRRCRRRSSRCRSRRSPRGGRAGFTGTTDGWVDPTARARTGLSAETI